MSNYPSRPRKGKAEARRRLERELRAHGVELRGAAEQLSAVTLSAMRDPRGRRGGEMSAMAMVALTLLAGLLVQDARERGWL